MTVAVASLIAFVAVLYALTGINTTSGTGDTIFNALLNQRTFSADNATTAILYSLLVFIGVFSGSLFVLRFLGLFAAVLGIPDDQQIGSRKPA
jgi:hypothetical protein